MKGISVEDIKVMARKIPGLKILEIIQHINLIQAYRQW